MREATAAEKTAIVNHPVFRDLNDMSYSDIKNEMFDIMAELHRRASGATPVPMSFRKH